MAQDSGASEAQLIVELEGVKGLYPRSSNSRQPLDSSNGGLHALGDINGDGHTDFVVAARRREFLGRGWIEAYSGKDGSLLWQVSGKSDDEAKAEGDEKGYAFEEIALVGDLNGDGIPEIYCREEYASTTFISSAFLFSGRDGSRLARSPVKQSEYVRRPVCWQDLNGDSVADIIFRARKGLSKSMGIQVFSGANLSPILERFDLWPEADIDFTDWLLPRFSDLDGDGIADCLLRRGLRQSNTDPVYTYEFAVFSGKDFSIIKKFETNRPRLGGYDSHAAAGDLNGDGVEDILWVSSTGAGPANRNSFLRAISGADGAILWQVLGTQLPGGQKRFLIDVQGQKTDLVADVRLEAPVLSIPDLNGDGVGDGAMVAAGPGGNGSRQAVLVFSGVDGQPLATLQLTEKQGRFLYSTRTPIILLESATDERHPGVAVAGRTPAGKTIIAIFVLPDLR